VEVLDAYDVEPFGQLPGQLVEVKLPRRDDLAEQVLPAADELAAVLAALLTPRNCPVEAAQALQVAFEHARVRDVPLLVGQPRHGPVEGDEMLQPEVHADRTAVVLDRLTGVAQPCRPIEEAKAEHGLPPATLELDGERLDLRTAGLA
jgi:hypothetical protein